MNRQKIGQILFWLGLIGIIAWQALTWIQNPIQRVQTAEELSGTVHAIWGVLFWIRTLGAGLGFMLSIIGVLLYTGKIGSKFWLLGLLPSVASGVGMMWEPSQHVPKLFGIGGAVILLSYFGILWLWTRTYAAYEGVARTGRQIQLLGYSFLAITGMLLCSLIGDPNVLALAGQSTASAEIVNISFGLSMLLLFVGHYVVASSIQEITASPQEALSPQPAATR